MAILGFKSKAERELDNYYKKERLGRIEEKRVEYMLKKKQKEIDRQARLQAGLITEKKRKSSFFKNMSNQLNRIKSAVPTNQPQMNRPQPIQRPERESHNFFEHRSEQEVYGDEGLTFFDSGKSRGKGRTGDLFGI